ncbi:structural maintenance of chromosomes protein 2 [Hermetia illucens]|uniref:structural maintenance of chromosomes protein 2 n=1 Tax=Hermetia illucens TaxID=343691 RepID=UPI0018CC6CA6|nr:structural maintenance of chromosomes protein 2 [Hermetia illucens]
MYIKSVILDGFKSYGRRTEVHGFDPEFTAITGLNGTGKSNILDSICFVLGITNLVHVRATNLQELIFKSGQAGITKATVTLLFDNTDPNQCPLGYEKCREISVTRQIDVGKKGKYLINGKNVQNKKVTDLFCSVQLNVNNPNFLIMQGRITKVLNMKPQEVLSMIEEAAGTSLYESKREITTKVIEKKDAKLRETNTLLTEEVEPKLEKLRTERAAFVEFQKICRDIEYLTRIHISFKYLKQKESLEATEKNISNLTSIIEGNKEQICKNKEMIVKAVETIKEIQQQIDEDSGGKLKQLEKLLEEKTKGDASATGNIKAAQGTIDQEKRKIKNLTQSIRDDEKTLVSKENQMEKFKDMFQKLKDADEEDAKAYADAQKRFEAITQGLSTNEEGEAASLQDQLMTAKQHLIEAQTSIKQNDMELKHSKKTLNQKKSESQTKDADYLKDKNLQDQMSANIKQLQAELSRLPYEEGRLEALQERHAILTQEIRRLKSQLDQKNAFRYDLHYKDPEPNFNRNKVHGMVGKLFRVRRPQDSLALMMCAGGDLYSFVTEDDVTSKKILQKGELARRVTLIPMNKLSVSTINPSTVKLAQRLVGEENAASALSLIEYNPFYEPVMKYVFGRAFICKDLNIAKQVTYHPNIMCRSVTLDGDVVDPEGTLSGGAAPVGANILLELEEIRNLDEAKKAKENELHQIEKEIGSIRNVAEKYNAIKSKLDLKQFELNACSQRLALTVFQQNQQEIQDLESKIGNLQETLSAAQEKENTARRKIKDIEAKLADAKGFRERELKAAQNAMKAAKKKSEESKSNWKKREQEYETLQLEIEEIKKSITNSKSQLDEISGNVSNLEENLEQLKDSAKKMAAEMAGMKMEIKSQKDKINAQNKELKSHSLQKDKWEKQIQELELEIKKKENEITKVRNDNKDAFSRIESLEEKYTWIKEDKEFFGIKNTRYDYSKQDPIEAGRKLSKMQEQKEKMERNINTRALMLLDREEEQYSEAMRRKKIVEEDKEKLKYIIKKMDEKKVEKVEKAWRSVNDNFSSIFSTLLPGAQAQLQPVYQNNALHGLQIRVGFNNVWKESLGELSGGQRSLVALSLVLAMLKFSPAPIYILDEVDAALDMSHTQNIGNMLKAHFKNSQFIIVSLKDGMFNNANVLFRTKFEEGVSSVVRTVNVRSTK